MRSAVPRRHISSFPGWHPSGLRPCSWPRPAAAPGSGSSAERRGGGWRGRDTAHGPAGPAISPTEVPGKTRPGGLPIEPRTAVIPTAKAEPWRRDRRRRRNAPRLGPGRGRRAGPARPSNVTRILAGSPVHGPGGAGTRCALSQIDRVTEAVHGSGPRKRSTEAVHGSGPRKRSTEAVHGSGFIDHHRPECQEPLAF